MKPQTDPEILRRMPMPVQNSAPLLRTQSAPSFLVPDVPVSFLVPDVPVSFLVPDVPVIGLISSGRSMITARTWLAAHGFGAHVLQTFESFTDGDLCALTKADAKELLVLTRANNPNNPNKPDNPDNP
jgi:hypothetical protein